MDSTSPSPPASTPLSLLSPLSAARKQIPRIAREKNSGDLKDSTSGVTMGMAAAREKAPTMAPTSELMSAAPRARPASPFLAMGWPSMMVAVDTTSPGTPNRIEVMSPVVPVTAYIPSRNANACTGSISKMNGSMRATAPGLPMPGRMPTMNPRKMPITINRNVV